MRILWITPDNPVPPAFGGAVFTTALTAGLAANGADVSVVASARRGQDNASVAAPQLGIARMHIHPRRHRLALAAAMLRHPRWPAGAVARWSDTMAAGIARDRADLAVLELSTVIPYLEAASRASSRVAFCVQNLQSVTQRSIAARVGGIAALAWRREAAASRRLEDRLFADPRLSAVLLINERERAILAERYPARANLLHMMPVAHVVPPDDASSAGARDGIVFVGTLDYPPNVDAALWLCREVMPRVRATRPGVRCALIGRRPGPALLDVARASQVEVRADVPDVGTHLQSAAVAAIPIRSGGGVKIKLLDAVTHGAPVVATTEALEGTHFTAGRHVLVADDADAFARACLAAIDDPRAARERAVAARAELVARHTPAAVARRLLEACGL